MHQNKSAFSTDQASLNLSALDNKKIFSGHYWAELRVFLAVAKGGSFNRASDLLGISQPTVSRQVKRLQDVIGAQLVLPSSQGIQLTQNGQALAKALAELDFMLSTISDDLGSERKEAAGHVRVAATEGLAGFFIAPNLPQVTDIYPRVQVTVQTPTNATSLRENATDILIGFVPETAKNISFKRLGTVHLIPVVSRAYVERYGIPTAKNLANHKFIHTVLYSGQTAIWDPWQRLIERGQIAHFADNSFAYGMMVKAGLGIGLLGNYVLLEPNAIPLELDVHIPVPLYAAVMSDRLESRPVRVVFDFLCEVFGSKNPWFDETLKLDPTPTHFDQGFRALFNIDMQAL